MPYLVGSDVLIAQREGQPGSLALLEQLAPEGLAISIITYMEVYQGTLRSAVPRCGRIWPTMIRVSGPAPWT
jgi:hypothetical protein